MDKNAIKKYAVWARTELIDRVSQKALQYGITEKDSIPASATSVNGVVLSNDEMKQRKALLERIAKKGYKQVMEEVAYTWFNRFSALRFMEVNGYLPSRVRVFTDENNQFEPQIIAEAIDLEMDGLDMEKVYAYKDANDKEGLFKYLIIVQCNALSPIMPRMFQRIADYTELLFPDNLLREGSAIQQMIELIPEDDWKDAVQIIGWLYQYYNTEKKDAVFADLKNRIKISKENVPAATQLFTPDWIVRYMVENSLGRLWVEGHPNDTLKAQWKYYLDEAEQEPDVQAQLATIRKEYAAMAPEQIKCIDPCAGSGHILVYMFDVLMQIYEDYGYSAREAVRGIIENNLYGLDIDERAAQLAYFAVMMKARQYDRRFFAHKDDIGNLNVPQPHIYATVESNSIDRYTLDYFINGDVKLKKAMDSIIKEMQDAKEYGSILRITPVDFTTLYARLDEVRDDIDMSKDIVIDSILPLIQVAEVIASKYDVVVTNPPYMGNKGFSTKLLDYITKYYYEGKIDFFAVFIQKCSELTKSTGIFSMITPDSWMFLSRFEKLRCPFLTTNSFYSIVHMGFGAFDGGFGTVAFSAVRRDLPSYYSTCLRLVDLPTSSEKAAAFPNALRIVSSKKNYKKVIGTPICYWASEKLIESFKHRTVKDLGTSCVGLVTGNNEQFIRDWYEIDYSLLGTGMTREDAIASEELKWFPINQSGDYRKWYGNNVNVFDWWHNGHNIKKFKLDRYLRGEAEKKNSKCWNEESYFREGLTWSRISTDRFSARYSQVGCTAGTTCPIYFPNGHDKYILGLLNSKVIGSIIAFLNPTVSFQAADIDRIPVIFDDSYHYKVDEIVSSNISLCRDDWDAFETSWDFKCHPLVEMRLSGAYAWGDAAPTTKLSSAYKAWEQVCEGRFNKLKENEEELNRIFIDIYGLHDELTSEVDPKDVTVRLADKKRDIKSLISYSVGCMFGRYSLDVPGLAYAGGEWDDSKYVSFPADKDNIIPICDDEYFPDDIVGRFVRFIEVVYGKETRDENLRFIADALGGSGQPKDVIRKYFMDEFYSDHLKIYQKRPIYWLFDSGKKGGFKALVYMHRYQPDTIARMRTDYVHEQQARYRTAIADIEQRIASASTSERVKLNKKLKTLQDQATEIQTYEEKIHHLADQYISIDLDDGVKKNYAIFGDVLAKIK